MLAGANAGRITLGVIVRSWLCASDWISQGPLSRRSHRCDGYAHERARRGIVFLSLYPPGISTRSAPAVTGPGTSRRGPVARLRQRVSAHL